LPAIYRAKEKRREAESFKPCHKNGCRFDAWKRVQNERGEFELVPCECRLKWEANHGKVQEWGRSKCFESSGTEPS
jgi:hypothetical protein